MNVAFTKYIFCVFLVFLFNHAVAERPKNRFFPETLPFPSIIVGILNGNVYNTGNYYNGKGKIIIAEALQSGTEKDKKSALGFSNYNYIVLELRYYDGEFSKSGENFGGRMSVVQVLYENNTDEKRSEYIPVHVINFENGLNDSGIYNFEGTGKSHGVMPHKSYQPISGKTYGKDLFRYIKGEYSSSFMDNQPGVTTITYSDGKLIKQTGMENPETHDFIYASTEYRNGERFDGFYSFGEKFGPGILYGKSNEITKSGFWNGEVLQYNAPISFPESFVTVLSKMNTSNPLSQPITIDKKLGSIFMDAKKVDGLFVSDDKSIFYYGSLSIENKNGLAYEMVFFDEPLEYRVPEDNYPRNTSYVKRKNQYSYSGKYKNNKLFEGAIQKVHTIDSRNIKRSNYLCFSKKEVGQFDADTLLTGCGQKHIINIQAVATADTLVNGIFARGKPINFYKQTISSEKIISSILHSKSGEMDPDKFYNSLLLAKTDECNTITRSEFKDYLAIQKEKADDWEANTSNRNALAKQKAFKDSIQFEKDVEKSIACDHAKTLVSYRASKGDIKMMVLEVNCVINMMRVEGGVGKYGGQSVVGSSWVSVLDAVGYEKFGQPGHSKLCGGCNGFRNIYKNKRTGVVSMRAVVEVYRSGRKSEEYDYHFDPKLWTAQTCKTCGGAGRIWINN